MKAPELFTPAQIPDSPSPKILWLRKHKIVVQKIELPENEFVIESPETGDDIRRFVASIDGRLKFGTGDTEDDALADLARKHSMRLWNE